MVTCGYSIASVTNNNSEVLTELVFQCTDFYNWNKVKIRYCDGASFSGNVKDEFQVIFTYLQSMLMNHLTGMLTS